MRNLITAILGIGLSVALIGAAADRANAVDHEPYGGCDESINYVSTAGADWCRDHGWTITRHIVVDPDRYVRAWHHLPACTFEDASGSPLPCRWNFGPGQMGNGQGYKYWVSASGRAHYVRGVR